MNRILLLVSIVLLFSCKKDKVPHLIDQGGLISPEGYYYGINTYEKQYTSDNEDVECDLVISIEVINDTITIDGLFKFPVSEYDMTNGSGSHTIYLSSGTWATLEYSNGFEQVYFYSHYNAGIGSPIFIRTFTGAKTNLAETDGNNQVYFNAMEGTYQLSIEEREDYNGLDTIYDDQVSIDYLPSSTFPGLSLNGNNRPFNIFHSYYIYHSQMANSGNFASYDKNFYWSNDSLNYDYLQRNWDFTYTYVDTIHYQYEGIKL